MNGSGRRRGSGRLAGIVLLSILIASIADHAVASWIRRDVKGTGENGDIGTYRRIGPETGPQVFIAGSSLLQFGLEWSDISAELGLGIENWGVAGSSPEIWEQSQQVAINTALTIIGVSLYDLNEYHLSAGRAAIVPFSQTVRDLWASGADWQFARRVLNQYSLTYVRRIFPTVGDSDAVLVGLRAKVREKLALAGAAEDKETALFLPSQPVLEFGESTAKVSDWPSARLMRRLALLSAENGGRHAFNGPKELALHRMLLRARNQGRVIVVVLPVTQAYLDQFGTPDVLRRFENSIAQAQELVPDAHIIRLDRVPGMTSHEYFSDLVHLNSAGRRLATAIFLKHIPPIFEQ